MNGTQFDLALDEKRMLRSEFLADRNFGACAYPDVMDRDEFLKLAALAGGAGPVLVSHAEFGVAGEMESCVDAESAWRSIFDLWHEDMIVEFSGPPLYVWLPAGEGFHVVFGNRDLVTQLANAEELDAEFAEYVAEARLSDRGLRHLQDVRAKYTV